MDEKLIRLILEALAVGDSFAKVTEFASRGQITTAYHSIDSLLPPSASLSHKDMNYAQVTDDTEQNVYLLEDFCKNEAVSPDIAAKSLLRWYEEAADPDKYIGPSSKKAILSIKAGMDISKAGISGTSCGGIMRTPAAVLCSVDITSLQKNIISTLLPTHNTAAAMEAAFGYGYALYTMQHDRSIDIIVQAAMEGCQLGRTHGADAPDSICAPSCKARIPILLHYLSELKTDDELLDFLFYVFGTTISSCDVFCAAFGLFLRCRHDVYRAIRLSTMLGGDTDTIGCLAAVLCCTYAKGHNIPKDIVQAVLSANHLAFEELSSHIYQFRNM